MNLSMHRMGWSAHLFAKQLKCIATTASTPSSLPLHLDSKRSQNGCTAPTTVVGALPVSNKASESAACDLVLGAASGSTNRTAVFSPSEHADAQAVLRHSSGAAPQAILQPAAAVVAATASAGAKGGSLGPHMALELGAEGTRPTTVAVAMSGGVDSAVTAKRLVDDGLQVLRFPDVCTFLSRPHERNANFTKLFWHCAEVAASSTERHTTVDLKQS